MLIDQSQKKIDDIIYINNEYVSPSEAHISIFDRGFLFADGVYEVIPVYYGHILFLKEHLIRLQSNLDLLKIPYRLDHDEWFVILNKLIAVNGSDRPIYIQITRGADTTRLHDYSDALTPTIIAFSLNPIELGNCLKNTNITIITLPDIRWKLCHIKSISLLGNVMLNKQAKEAGADEVLLINEHQYIVEGSTSNYFIVKNNQIITPPLNNELLPGITRQIVFNLCAKHNMPILETNITEEDLYNADEIWLTSSTKEIRSVGKINNKTINNGQAGPVWQKIVNLYIDYIKTLQTTNKYTS